MISILVTGANGQLGKCIQDVAKKNQDKDWVFKTSKELDITNQSDIQDLFSQKKFNYLINCAAYTAVDKAEAQKEEAYLVNAEAVKYLAETCKIYDTVLLHISTDFVFDGTKRTPYIETDKPNPINVYGASKLKGEEYIQEILKCFFIIRTSWVYSEHGHNFVKTMIRLAKEKNEISVVSDQIGSPTYAVDLAKLIVRIIQNNENYGIYHFSNDAEISWDRLAKEIFKQTKAKTKVLSIETKDYPVAAERPKYSVMSKEKMKNNFGASVSPWKESLKDCLSKTIML